MARNMCKNEQNKSINVIVIGFPLVIRCHAMQKSLLLEPS
jgi:hypothetical protein